MRLRTALGWVTCLGCSAACAGTGTEAEAEAEAEGNRGRDMSRAVRRDQLPVQH